MKDNSFTLNNHEENLISCEANDIHKNLENLVEYEKKKYKKNNRNL